MVLFLIFKLFFLIYFFYKFVWFVNETNRLLELYKKKIRDKNIALLAWQYVSIKATRNFLFCLRKQQRILYELQKIGLYVETKKRIDF